MPIQNGAEYPPGSIWIFNKFFMVAKIALDHAYTIFWLSPQ